MGAMSLWHWLIVIAIVLILFGGRGKISDVMGDFAKGIKSFKKGMADDPVPAEQNTPVQAAPLKTVEEQPALQFVEEEEVLVREPARSKPKAAARTSSKATSAKTTTTKTTSSKAPAAKKAAASKSTATKTASAKPVAKKPAASRKKETT